MKKKIWLPLIAIMVMMCAFMFDKEVYAANASGTYGDLAWSYTDGVLEITGNGEMTSTEQADYPWYNYRDSVETLILGEGVTSIGSNAFQRFSVLESVVLSDSVKTIHSEAFYGSAVQTIDFGNGIQELKLMSFCGCEGLTKLEFPSSLEKINGLVFVNCLNITEVRFTGDAPTSGADPFAAVTATVYYPGSKEGWTDELKAAMAFEEGSTWIAYCDPGQHTFTDYVYNDDATCTEDGTETADCASCGLDTHTRTAVGTALGHTFVDGLCTRPGCIAEGPVATGTHGTNISWSFNRQGVLTLSGSGKIAEPEFDDDYNSLASWCAYKDRITSLVIGEGITEIGRSAFFGLDNLASVTLPNTLTTIENQAFLGTKIQTLTLPANVKTLAYYSFYGMTELEKIEVVSNNAAYSSDSYGALYNKNKTSLIFVPTNVSKDFTIAGTVTEIREYAFTGTVNITKVNVPEGVTTIGYGAFTESCVTEVVLPSTLTDMHEDTIIVSPITSVTVHEDNKAFKTIGTNQLFNKDMTKLIWTEGLTGSYVVPDTVKEIGTNAIWMNDDIEKLTIPANIEKIEVWAFDSCSNLKTVLFKGNAPEIGGDAFLCVEANVYYPEDNDTWTSAVRQDYGGTLTWISYSGDILDLGACGTDASWVLTSDGTLTVSGSGTMTDYSFYPSPAPWYDYKDTIKSIVVKHGITSIGNYAFLELEKLTSVSLPNTLTKIGNGAFEDCIALKSITIPNSVSTIGKWAFTRCKALKEFNIPSKVTVIPQSAFSSCAVEILEIPSTVTQIDDSAFANCSNLKKIYFIGKAPTVGESVFYGVAGYAYYRSNDYSWTTAKKDALSQDSSLKWASGSYLEGSCGNYTSFRLMMDGCLYISGDGSMSDYTKYYGAPWDGYYFHTVVLNEGVTSIGDYAFYNCTNLKQITMPESLTYIGQYAFYNCYFLEELVIPDDVYIIGSYAFYRCESLKKITLPADLGAIYSYTFLECTDLEEIAIPKSVKNIQNYAFSRCESLKKITFKGKAPEMSDYAFDSITATTYYPKDSTWTSSMRKDYGGDLTWRCTTPTTPGNVKATNTASTGKIKLTWTKSPEAAKYRIYRATSKNGTYKLIKTLSKSYTSFTDSDAKVGTTYYYKIKAVASNDKTSSYSSVVSQTPDLKRPTIKVTNVASSGKLKVTWSKISGAKEYKIYRATTKSGTYKLMKTQTGTSYTDTSATAGKTYYYKVIAVHKTSKANSAYSTVVSGVCDLKQPTIKVTNDASTGKTKVTWSKISGAAKYRVYRATSKTGKYTAVKVTTGTSYTDTSATAGKTYYYKVVAVHKTTSANSAESAVKSGVCDLKRPNVTVKLNSKKKPALSWSKISGAKSYKIYRATSENGKYTLLKTQTGVSYTDTKAVKGKTYYYKVIAVHKTSSANSAYSAVDKIKVK